MMKTSQCAGRSPPRIKYSTWPFFATLVIISAIAFYSTVREHSSSNLLVRDVSSPDLECRLVHGAKDKCDFVRNNCPDEEAGIFSYLELYYCKLPHAQPVTFVFLVLWLALLFTTIGIAASDFFCLNLSTIANVLHMSDSLAGVTFLAFGNGSPDIFSTFAAMNTNSGSLAVGELIGAASFITAVVAGSIAFIKPFKVPKKAFVRDISFFIVAASFSLVFLFDGHIHLWEACFLVGLYVFYVIFVLVWHWFLNRRKARRAKQAAARGQFVTPGVDEIVQEYHDLPDDEGDTRSRRTTSRVPTMDDLAALERQGEDDNEDSDDQVGAGRAEVTRKMRVSRQRARSRARSGLPIRPSLAGALEFQAVLTDLKRSRSIQNVPIILRRYSDDPRGLSADQISTHSDPHTAEVGRRQSIDVDPPNKTDASHVGSRGPDGRARSVSVNDMAGLRLDTRFLDKLDSEQAGSHKSSSNHMAPHLPRRHLSFDPPSPIISISPSPMDRSPVHDATAINRARSPSLLAPPDPFQSRSTSPARSTRTQESTRYQSIIPEDALTLSPDALGPQHETHGSKFSSPSPFPAFRDELPSGRPRAQSLHLPEPGMSLSSSMHGEIQQAKLASRSKWWPYRFLPPPGELFETLFPTLASWHDKGIFGKIAAVIIAPSVFLLKITLPVVETDRGEDDEDDEEDEGPAGPVFGHVHPFEPELDHRRHSAPLLSHDARLAAYSGAGLDSAQTAVLQSPAENGKDASRRPSLEALLQSDHQSPEPSHGVWDESERKDDWHRWLTMVQCVMAPFFVVLIFWVNVEPENPKALWESTLISLLGSCVALLIVLTTSTPIKPPKWRLVLCILGFVVSIAWISTIANEVVGVLKALGVIMNISDAILGLTIFAVGNSLGDLVANVTVARLGLPNMALSACFGGPMLNILLGIGLSGMYLTIKNAEDRTHRGKKLKFKPYHIEVNRTLLISGATLLVTLVVLLIVVPLRKWRMDRAIGWCLMGFWLVSTVANVVVEVTGLARHGRAHA